MLPTTGAGGGTFLVPIEQHAGVQRCRTISMLSMLMIWPVYSRSFLLIAVALVWRVKSAAHRESSPWEIRSAYSPLSHRNTSVIWAFNTAFPASLIASRLTFLI